MGTSTNIVAAYVTSSVYVQGHLNFLFWLKTNKTTPTYATCKRRGENNEKMSHLEEDDEDKQKQKKKMIRKDNKIGAMGRWREAVGAEAEISLQASGLSKSYH